MTAAIIPHLRTPPTYQSDRKVKNRDELHIADPPTHA